MSRGCRDLIARHVELTGSPRGKWILANWGTMLPKFVKVFPHEYKRVLRIPQAQSQVTSSAVAGPSSGRRPHG